jgi:hypothetical protein
VDLGSSSNGLCLEILKMLGQAGKGCDADLLEMISQGIGVRERGEGIYAALGETAGCSL